MWHGRMVEQVVGSGQLDALSASHVRRYSRPVPVVLGVETACQRRDVAAALAAPTAMTALAGVGAELAVRVWRRDWQVRLAN
jgi:hypothetical protein